MQARVLDDESYSNLLRRRRLFDLIWALIILVAMLEPSVLRGLGRGNGELLASLLLFGFAASVIVLHVIGYILVWLAEPQRRRELGYVTDARIGVLLRIWVPLHLLQTRSKESALVATHAKEVVNFQLTVFSIASLMIALAAYSHVVGGAAVGVLIFLGFLYLCSLITGGIAFLLGRHYLYPLTVRLVR